MRKIILFLFIFHIIHLPAQESIWWKTPTTSPEIYDNHMVTFRLVAPRAKEVQLVGEFLPPSYVVRDGVTTELTGIASMRKGGDGVWTYTTPRPVNPGYYNYNFVVDGLTITDPSNIHTSRDVVKISSVFFIEGGWSDYYRDQDVPHHALTRLVPLRQNGQRPKISGLHACGIRGVWTPLPCTIPATWDGRR